MVHLVCMVVAIRLITKYPPLSVHNSIFIIEYEHIRFEILQLIIQTQLLSPKISAFILVKYTTPDVAKRPMSVYSNIFYQ